MPARPRVLFVTSVFDDVVNGPATYAGYLWDAFRDDEDLDFHLVAPQCHERHDKIHSVDTSGRRVMWDIQRRALEIVGDAPDEWIVHGNSAYMMFSFVGFSGRWIVQVNDYEAATVWNAPADVVRQRGLRRFLSLAWRRRKENEVVSAATRVLGNSAYLREILTRQYKLCESDRISIVHKGVQCRHFSRPKSLPDDPMRGLPRGSRLLFVGANWRLKGLPALLQALPNVLGRFPNCRLVVAGPGESQHRTIRTLAKRIGVADKIHLVGAVSRKALPTMMWHCDLFVLPAIAEAFGVTILEALASGLPVVASETGGIPEIIRSDDEGLLVPVGNGELLASAICRRLGDEHCQRLARTTGPVRASDFSIEKTTARLKEIYRDVANRPHP